MPTIIIVVLFGLLGGFAVGLQGPLASLMTRQLGLMESIFIVHLGGALFVGLPLVLLHGGGNLGRFRDVPWYALGAGLMGLIIISAVSYTIPRVGVAPTVTLVVAGQLVLSTVLDHFGWLGTDVHRIDPVRLLGIVVLFVGVWLIVR